MATVTNRPKSIFIFFLLLFIHTYNQNNNRYFELYVHSNVHKTWMYMLINKYLYLIQYLRGAEMF